MTQEKGGSVKKAVVKEKIAYLFESDFIGTNRELGKVLSNGFLNAIEALHNNVTRYLIIYLDRLSAQDISQKEHLAIFNACKRLNIDAAINQLSTHLRKASKRLMAFLS